MIGSRSLCFVTALFLMGSAFGQAQQAAPVSAEPERPKGPKPKPFEISNGNLFEALRQMAAYRKLDLLIDPDVPNQKGLYAFKHTTWEKALDALMASHGLGCSVRDGILHVGLAGRLPVDPGRPAALEGNASSRTVAITFHPAAEGEATLSISANKATRAEILEALAKIERIAKAKPGQRSFNAHWVLRPVKDTSREEFETFSMEDVTPSGLRALYP